MQNYCNVCNYTAKTIYNYNQHINTKKHINNQNIKNIEINKLINENNILKDNINYKNNLLNGSKAQISKLKNEIDKIKDIEKKYNDLNNEYYEKNKYIHNLKSHIVKLKNEIENLKNDKIDLIIKYKDEQKEVLTDIINKSSKLMDKNDTNKDKDNNKALISVSALTYANKHFSDSPVLEKIDNFKINNLDYTKQNDKDKLIDIIIHSFENGILYKLLGDHIIQYYKKDDLRFQSFHSTDCSRLNYIVKELFDKQEISRWIQDKNGIIISNKIIIPLITKCGEILIEFQKKLTSEIEPDFNYIDKRLYCILNIISYIDNDNLMDDINKYIAPFFSVHKLISS